MLRQRRVQSFEVCSDGSKRVLVVGGREQMAKGGRAHIDDADVRKCGAWWSSRHDPCSNKLLT